MHYQNTRYETEIYDTLNIQKEFLTDNDDKIGIVEIFQGLNEKGDPFYAYLSIKPSKLIEYKMIVSAMGELDLEEFGDVLYHAEGSHPDIETQQYIEKKFGIDHTKIKLFNDQINDITEKVKKEEKL